MRNDVTSRDPAHLYPWVDFVNVFGRGGGGGWESWSTFLMKNIVLTV